MADEARGTFTVDDALITLGFGKYQFCVLGYAALAWISEAMEMMLLSFIGPVVQRLWHLSAKQQSLITSVVFIGMLIGAYSWGVVADKYGRRVGGGPVLCSWLLEFIPPPNRGTWMVVFQAFWTVGTVFEASIAWIVMPRFGWRWLLGFSSIPSFGLLAFYFITPESPRHLCLNGRTKEAMIILERIGEVNGTKVPLGTLVTDDYQAGIEEDGTPTKPKQGPFSTILKLLSRELIRPTLLLWVVFFGNSFTYYGLVLLTTELNAGCSRCAGHKTSKSQVSEDVNYKDVFITTFADSKGNNRPFIWLTSMHHRNLHHSLHICSGGVSDLLKNDVFRISKLDGKNRWYDMPLCCSSFGAGMSSNSCHWEGIIFLSGVPPELDMISGNSLSAVSASMATLEPVNAPRKKKLSRIPSKKIVAKSLLVAGAVICLSRGHAGLGTKVAMAYILTKLRKHCHLSSQSRQTRGT
ncbi:Organic cation/carnitine transporter 7 [Hibiscus syriacus]|uniref:Organic cation/carnitine transporter 7 n=1 Tax=Hibiscus syriacus TaxID=106335 RepID=A0A6A3A4T6_HIBSY|nr:Organic cation/carnitine transporter 7 [Hibiscus syriacus]